MTFIEFGVEVDVFLDLFVMGLRCCTEVIVKFFFFDTR